MGIGWKTPTKTAFLVVADEDIKDIGFFCWLFKIHAQCIPMQWNFKHRSERKMKCSRMWMCEKEKPSQQT